VTAKSKSPTLLQTLNERSRRLLLIVGLGMMAAILGAIIAAPFAVRFQTWLLGAPLVVAVLVNVLIARFWVLGVLPVIGYAMGRALRLRPLSFAFGAAASGEVFYLLLDVATAGLSGVVARPALLAARIATLAGGILLTLRATRAGVRAADKAQAAANQSVAARKDEYAEMMRHAEELADRRVEGAQPVVGTAAVNAATGTAVAAKAESTTASGVEASGEAESSTASEVEASGKVPDSSALPENEKSPQQE